MLHSEHFLIQLYPSSTTLSTNSLLKMEREGQKVLVITKPRVLRGSDTRGKPSTGVHDVWVQPHCHGVEGGGLITQTTEEMQWLAFG